MSNRRFIAHTKTDFVTYINTSLSFILVLINPTRHSPDMDANSTTEPGLSSLIITLTKLPELRASALQDLAINPALELGVFRSPWLPAVLTSADPYDAFRDIEAIPGVELVEVVFVELPAVTTA
jgi:hypothetical protein